MTVAGISTADDGQRRDFFISYAEADQAWAKWIAVTLEQAGYTIFIQAFDFRPGSNFVHKMQSSTTRAELTIAVLSPAYLQSEFGEAEWGAAFVQDPSGERGLLLPIRVRPCEPPGLLAARVYVDLIGVDEQAARRKLLAAVNRDRDRPQIAAWPGPTTRSAPKGEDPRPNYPGSGQPTSERRAKRPKLHYVRVADVDPRTLGIHAAIEMPRAATEMPSYVMRDVDAALDTMLERKTSYFLLLVGGSSVGKTRTAFEAILRKMPDWSIAHPANVLSIHGILDDSPSQTIIWLDEFQGYVRDGLTAGMIRDLLQVDPPTVIIGTLWPDYYQKYSEPPPSMSEKSLRRTKAEGIEEELRTSDSDDEAREMMKLATVIRVGSRLSSQERIIAAQLSNSDPRIAEAINSEFGFTQALAAAPALVHRWELAPDGYCKAVMSVAIDLRRLGVQSPLSAHLLKSAAQEYLTTFERARASSDWFEGALDYATRELLGAAAVLNPVAATIGAVSGYTLADYLHQHDLDKRRLVAVADSILSACKEHLKNGQDLFAVAREADLRKRTFDALDLYKLSAEAGHAAARIPLALLLRTEKRVDEAFEVLWSGVAEERDSTWRHLVDWLLALNRVGEAIDVCGTAGEHGHKDARIRQAGLLEQIGEIDKSKEALQLAAQFGDERALLLLGQLFRRAGQHEEEINLWRSALKAGNPQARDRLALSLQKAGRSAEAITVWRSAHASGEAEAIDRLVGLLGRSEEAVEVLREAAATHQPRAWAKLTDLLLRLGRVDEAVDAWQQAIDAGEPGATRELIGLLRRLRRPLPDGLDTPDR